MAKYLLKPVLNTVKQAFYLKDESGKTIYEGKMTKFSLFGASPFEFANHVTGKTEVHKVGKTVTVESGGNDIISFLSKRSYFKYDDKKIWDYLHDQGVRIDTGLAGNKLGMRYEVTFKGAPLATIATSSPSGKSFITTGLYYDVICEEKDLDLVFLVAFSIARTDQNLYS